VRVHRRVHGRVEHAQDEVGTREREPRRREADRGERERRADARQDRDPRAARTGDEHAGETPGEQPPDGQGGDGGAELGVREVERVLDRGQAREHRGGDRAVREEQRADGDPGTPGTRGIDGRGH
jgi:hypothetical protein